MMLSRFLPTSLLSASLALSACTDSKATSAPVAPSTLTATALSGGAHLTWKDNSDNETEFMVMRMQVGTDADYKTLTSVPFNTTAYHDAQLTSGKAYMYKVMAMNDAGESYSNEITFNAP